MAASDAKPDKTPVTDSTEAALKAKQQLDTHAALLKDSQTAKAPPTAKEKEALADTVKLVTDFKKAFTDRGATPAQADLAFGDFARAKDDAGRAKVFTDANVKAPDVVKQYEAKYGADTSAQIFSSVALAKRLDAPAKPAPAEAAKPTDVRIPAAPVPAAADADPGVTLDRSKAALDKAVTALNGVQADGKPLPDSTKQILQAAVDASSKVTPDVINKVGNALYSTVPGWTHPQEDQYIAVNKAFQDAAKNLSPTVLASLQKMPQGTSLPAKLAAVEKMNEPTAQALKQADIARDNFYKANPAADNRDAIDPKLKMLGNLSHAPAYSAAIYSEALAKTGNAGDVPQAKAMMNEAAKDQFLGAVIPDIAKVYDNVMALKGPATAAPEVDPLDKTVPGWTATKAALSAMQDQTLSPEQRMAKAAPLFESALQASKAVNPDDIDKNKVQINQAVSDLTGGRAKSLDDLDRPELADVVKAIMDDPEKKAKAQTLVQDSNTLDTARGLNLKVSEAYATALSKTASELQAQANSDPSKAARLNGEANAYTQKASTVLKAVGQNDSNFGVAVDSASNPADAQHTVTLNQQRIQEEIAQVNRGEAIDPVKAAAKSGAQTAVDAINDSVLGHKYNFETQLFGNDVSASFNALKTIRPLIVGIDATTTALDAVHDHMPKQVPLVGAVAGFTSDMMKGFLPSPANKMDGAVEDLANAKVANPEAAKAVMAEKKESVLGGAVSVTSDLASGQIGMLAAKAAPGLLAKLPQLEETALKTALESGNWKIKLGAAATVGVAAAFGSRLAADELSHDLLGTKRMTVGELASHSTASLAAAYTARGLTSAMPATEGAFAAKLGKTALTSGLTNTVFGVGEVNPFQINKATGQHFTVADTALNAVENLGYGATTGLAGRALAPVMHFSTVGVAQGITGVAKGVGKFVFNSEAGKEVVADAASAASKEIKPVFAGWTDGVLGTSWKGAVAREAIGGAIGATGSLVAVNPWENNDATGKKYTFGETAESALKYGAIVGTGLNAARYSSAIGGIAYRAGVNALPGEGSTVAKFMGLNGTALAARAGVGFAVGTAGSLALGDKVDANGKPLTTGEIFQHAAVTGLEFGAGLGAAPFIASGVKRIGAPIVNPAVDGVNAGRRFLGRAAENTGAFIADKANAVAGEGTTFGKYVVSPVSKVTDKVGSVTGDAKKNFGPAVNDYLISHSTPVSTGLAGFYEAQQLNTLDKQSDKLAKEKAAEAAKEAQQDQQNQ